MRCVVLICVVCCLFVLCSLVLRGLSLCADCFFFSISDQASSFISCFPFSRETIFIFMLCYFVFTCNVVKFCLFVCCATLIRL
jgi:hypothetical protein